MSGYSAVSKNIEEIVKQHEGLVRRVAHHVHGRVHSVVEYDDLLQIGFIGLIQAAQRYTPQEGVTFPNYAVLRVRGAMYDYLRKNSNLCRKSIRMQQQRHGSEAKAICRLG
jgi:RNA polymerase sigma factor for flagellar operon FliA